MSLDQIIMAPFIPVSAGVSVHAFLKAWTNFRLLARGQWIEAEIVRVREEANGDGDPRFYPEVAFTPPDSDEVRVESKVGRLYPIDRRTRIRVRYDPAKPRRARLQGYGGPGLFVSLLTGGAMAFLAVGLFLHLFT
ncbi:DUF3592 domain-containing protein [Streptomyces sp. NPDC006622]|uniref:DUF3592 domain-containing protein n=1 Tax=Streptomyces sp. NPDC006622 TaxID=3155459 RepID=UPI0033B93D04